MATLRKFDKCPRCGSALGPTPSFSGGPCTFWLECTKCNTFVDTYMPLKHQESLHVDNHKLIGNFGGYGTGKSLTDIKDLQKHLLITPAADAMVTANITYQYEQTIKKEFERDIPRAFVKSYSVKNQKMILQNESMLSYRPLDDPNKLRSNNLTYFLIVEGSETSAEAFHQLKTRLRNNAATTLKKDNTGVPIYNIDDAGRQIPIIEHDWRKGVVESNPDAGWINTDLLLCSSQIYQHGKNNDEYTRDPNEIDPLISSHISTTDVNTFLPSNYIDMISKNKPAWWVDRYVRSSFLYAEGSVYPKAMDCIAPEFKLPDTWKHIVAFDYGLSDDAVFLFGAVDEQAGILWIYKEIVMHDLNIEHLATRFKKETAHIGIGAWVCPPIMDPKNNKRDYNKKDLASHFSELGIHFQSGYIGLDARVLRTNTYLEMNKLFIMDCCPYLIKQLKNYKFVAKTLDNKKRTVKPIDKDNHAINPLEWICMALPADPRNLNRLALNKYGKQIEEAYTDQQNGIPWQLQGTKLEVSKDYEFNFTNTNIRMEDY